MVSAMRRATVEIEPEVPQAAIEALEQVVDPEIPVLTIRDLGVLRGARMDGDCVVVTITPTYSGCPAMVEIRENIETALKDAGIVQFRIKTSLSPAWTTDWMSEEGRRKLLEYGIAPPQDRDVNVAPTSAPERHTNPVGATFRSRPVPCPQCGSDDTRLISEFGSTACKSLHQCNACLEPFDHFKCH